MKLEFSQKLKDGTPTNFVEKIIAGLHFDLKIGGLLNDYIQPSELNYNCRTLLISNILSFENKHKIHTIRYLTESKAREWKKKGQTIEPIVNKGKDNEFQFAPSLQVFNLQKVEINNTELAVKLTIGDDFIFFRVKGVCFSCVNDKQMASLVTNSGFDSMCEFWRFFNPDYIAKKKLQGKEPYIIHWTNLKY